MSVVAGRRDEVELLELPRRLRVSHRALRVGVLIGAVAILNSLDLMYTVFADGMGRANHVDVLNEMNPLAAVFLQLGLVPSLICFKVLLAGCGLGLLWKLRQSRWALPACWLLLVVYVILGGVWCAWVNELNQTMEVTLASAR